jgi:hypothetical protein
LIQKIHRHEMYWMTAPPMIGPADTPRPVTPPQMPIAAARFSAGKASLIRARVSGSTAAPPAPWITRAMISSVTVFDMAAPAEAAANSSSPLV